MGPGRIMVQEQIPYSDYAYFGVFSDLSESDRSENTPKYASPDPK